MSYKNILMIIFIANFVMGCAYIPSITINGSQKINAEQSRTLSNETGAERLPRLTKENAEAYTRAIIRSSSKQCVKLVKSLSQDLEPCIYNLTNRYFAKLYEEGVADRLIHLDMPERKEVYAEKNM